MARVFRAELAGPEGFRKPVAIKIIRGSLASLKTGLIHEARLGGLLGHPNIVSTIDFGEQDGHLFIAMELVDGWTLAEVLASRGALPPEIALEIAAQVCDGLDHAHHLHDGGVPTHLVHRDLKPSNVILDRAGRVLVMDFGIARSAHLHGNTTADGMTKGTPTFMSPEQAMGRPVDRRSDLFAMGILLYEMLTGRPLFGGDNLAAVMFSIFEVESRLADPLHREPLARHREIEAVVLRCLRRDPAERFSTAMELGDTIRAVQDRLGPRPRLREWLTRSASPETPRPEPPGPTPDQVPPSTSAATQVQLPPPPGPPTPTRLLPAAGTVGPATDELPLTGWTAPRTGPPPVATVVLVVGALGLMGAAFLAPRDTGKRGDPGGTAEHTGTPPPTPGPTPTPATVQVSSVTARPVTPAQATATPLRAPPSTTPPGAPPAIAPNESAPQTPVRAVPGSPNLAIEPGGRLVHSPPATVTVGSPLHLSARVEPATLPCRPWVVHHPLGSDDSTRTPMQSGPGGTWDARLPVPYDEAFRQGVAYQILCDPGSGPALVFPATGFQAVPALAR